DYLLLPTGEKLALRGVQNVKGGGHTGAMTGGMVATAIVFFPAAPFFLFMHGKDISIPKGQEVTVYTNSDYAVDPSKFVTIAQPAGTPAQQQVVPMRTRSGTPLTNEDIVKLRDAGLSEALIIAKI